MEASFKLDVPMEAKATLTTTMTMKKWSEVLTSLESGSYSIPAAEFRRKIEEMIRAAQEHFSRTHGDGG